MDVNEYKDIYLAESREYLQSLNDSLLKLEDQPGDQELVQEMFRSAHSLKGMSATMGFERVTRLTHEMENLLHILREGSLTLSSQLADVLFGSLDLLESLMAQIENPRLPEVDVEPFIEKLNRQMGRIEGGEERDSGTGMGDVLAEGEPFPLEEFEKEIIKEAREQGQNIYCITVEICRESLLKSVRAYMVVKALEEKGVIIKADPAVNDLEEDNFDHSFALLFQSKGSEEDLRPCLEAISEIQTIEFEPYENQEGGAQEKGNGEAPRNREEGAAPVKGTTGSLSMKEKTVRVDTGKLDSLINLVGELVINRTRILELSKNVTERNLADAAGQLDGITTELQSAIMKLRMVPIKQVFDRFPRMVRDLSREKGKKVRLEIFGEDTELDRSIVNQVGDPLIHLLRNAIDHGIESEEERAKGEKPPEGTITLTARHEGSNIAIEVKDDGAGLDPGKIVARALREKIITQEEAESMKEAEAYKLIFTNGLSTAREVTDVSGRGVGMDAVKKIVESLNGLIEVQSMPGEGTCITIRLPLTLAIIRALLVRSCGETYAIPVENIRENLHIRKGDIKHVNRQNVISLRKDVIPLVSLDGCLKGREDFHWSGDIPTVIVTSGEKKAGLMVDELMGQQEIVIKSLGNMLGKLKGIAGATVLGNGKVALILNIATLV